MLFNPFWFRYYIGAVDRDKGTMTIHRAELMHLRPYIPGKDTDTSLQVAIPPFQIYLVA